MREVVQVVAVTNIGHERESNEDRVVVGPWILAPDHDSAAELKLDHPPFVAAVLDGMGGHAAGGTAATIAAEVVASQGVSVDDASSAAYLAEWANRAIYERMLGVPSFSGMGTTLVGLAWVDGNAVVFNVGDARAYLESDGYMVQLSVDDASGKGTLTQSLGGLHSYQPIQPHVVVEPAKGARFLLATDGLFGHLDEEILESCLVDDDVGTVENLLRAALDAGGPDNVSIVLVRCPGAPDSEEGGGG